MKINTSRVSSEGQPSKANPSKIIAELGGAHELNEFLVAVRKKFHQMDVLGHGVLQGDEIVSLVFWAWTVFHDGKVPCH